MKAPIQITETFIQGKQGVPLLCEDAIVANGRFYAVIDGVTSKSDFDYRGKTTGKLAAELIAETLDDIPLDATLDQLVSSVNSKFHAFYTNVNFPYDQSEKGLQAAAAIYSPFYEEMWMIGDCQVLLDDVNFFNTKRSDDILGEMRSLFLTIRKDSKGELTDTDIAEGRSLILPRILESTRFANRDDTPYGYSVFNGEPIPKSLIRVIAVGDAKQLVMTSDGYPKVFDTLVESESYLQYTLRTDPLLIKQHPMTKGMNSAHLSYDDRAYLRLRLQPDDEETL